MLPCAFGGGAFDEFELALLSKPPQAPFTNPDIKSHLFPQIGLGETICLICCRSSFWCDLTSACMQVRVLHLPGNVSHIATWSESSVT